MFSKILELKQERAEVIGQARKLLEHAESENRGLNDTEKEQKEKLFAKAAELKERADALEAQDALDKELEAAGLTDEQRAGSGSSSADEKATEQADLFLRALTADITGRRLTADEQRALQVTDKSAGGYLVPEQLVQGLWKDVDDMLFIRQFATIVQAADSDSLGVPYLGSNPADGTWGSEISTVSEDSTMDFEKRELQPTLNAELLLVSRRFLRKATNAEQIVRERLAYVMALTAEKAYMTGTGAGQPLGIFTASAKGISTGRDKNTSNTTTAIAAASFKAAKYHLKSQYRSRKSTRWIIHRDVCLQLSLLTDSSGRYLWQEGIRQGDPDTLLNIPILESENAPNTLTASQYVAAIGDLSQYMIADGLQMEIQRLDEKYATTHQVGFIPRFEADGMPIEENAFARVQMAAS